MTKHVGAWIFALAVAAVTAKYLPVLEASKWSLFDMRIYREATHAVINGDPGLYSTKWGGSWLFTYPPFAVLVFGLFDWLPMAVASGGIAFASVLAMARICWIVADRMAPRLGGWVPAPYLAAGLLVFAGTSEPMGGTIGFGQVNAVLMWLVVEDFAGLGAPDRPGHRFGGALTGIAAGIKLTPALMWLPRALAGERRAAWLAPATGFGTALLGLIFLPAETKTFVTEAMWDSSRPGNAAYGMNQSLNGVIHRMAGADGNTAAYVLLAGLALVLGVGAAVLLLREGDRVGAALTTATVMSLISPISWSHHLVLVPLWIVWVVATTRHVWVRLVAVVAGMWVYAGWYSMAPHGNDVEYTLTGWERILSNAAPLLLLVVLAGVAGSAARRWQSHSSNRY